MNKTLINRSYTLFKTGSQLHTSTSITSTFNSRPKLNPKFSLFQDQRGLFDVPELQTYKGFYLLKEHCVEKSDLLIKEALNANRSRKIVEVFDELSDTICKVADLAEFIRLAHPQLQYTKAAEAASASINSIVERLNTDQNLYTALSNVVRFGDKFSTNEIDNLVGHLFLFDFEQSGIHLPEVQRSRVVALNYDLLLFGQQFVAGCGDSRIIKKQMLPSNLQYLFTSDGDNIVVSGLCSDSSDPVAREVAYRVYLQPDENQDSLLSEILKTRDELARICGFPTYAHRALKGSTLETPETVMHFLDNLSEGLRTCANSDFEMMNKMKMTKNNSGSSLQIWDTSYFTNTAKKALFNVECNEYAAYFSLGACMEGLNNLFNHIYGISFAVQDIMPGECWSWDVYKIEVRHETEGLLGHIYCDFFERPGKISQDCHFTIRGGKVLADGSYQHPIVVVMLNLAMPHWSSPTLLTPTMVDALFHEMGHAMHSMLARTRYQHVTGTRCSTDIAEVPSILMEYFANDPRVIKTFARHFQTREPMPENMVQDLCASKNLFIGSEMQMQLFYSALDQLYHGKHPIEGSTTDLLAQVQQKYYSLPYIQDTAWQLRFSHLIGYGAKYYSYLVSRALASCIWQNFFENDPFNRKQGDRFRHEFLAFGGSKAPRTLISDFLLKEPTNDVLIGALLKEIDSKQCQIHY